MEAATSTAIPFILNSQKGFYLTQQAITFLKGMTAPVGIITVVGKYRTGKSLFVNRVLINNANGFKVGPSVNPCTKGLWLWRESIKAQNPEQPDMQVLVIDSEGFGGMDENSNHDSRIMLFALLLSSFFIYNSVGSIDENSLNCLNLIINLAKEIQSKTSEEVDAYFPSFLWVIRDFSLQIVDKDGCPIGSKQYLERALEMQKGISDNVQNKNKLRRMIKHFFKDRDCATLVRPVETETELQQLDTLDESELRPEFVEQIKALRKKIFKKVKPKNIHNKTLNGPMLIQLAIAYIEAVNNGGLPSIENAWTYVRRRECEKAVDAALIQLQTKLDGASEKLSDLQLKQLKKNLSEELFCTFRKKSIGDEDQLKPYMLSMKQTLNKRMKEFKQINIRKWHAYYQEIFQDLCRDFREALEAQKIQSIYDYRRTMAQIKDQFTTKVLQGPGRSEFLKDMEIKFNNEYLFRLIGSTDSKRTKELEFSSLRIQRIEEQRKQQRKLTKQLQHRIWQLEKSLMCKQDEVEGLTRRSEHITSGLKNEVQRLQSELLSRKNSQERLQSESEYLRKLVEDSKTRLETMTSRLIEMEISKKQLFEQNKNSISEIENANYLLSTKDEQIARLTKELQKAQQSFQREKLKQSKLNESCVKLKVDNELRHNQLADIKEKYTRLLKEFDDLGIVKYDLTMDLHEYKEKINQIKRQYQDDIQSLQQSLQQEITTKQELTETNKNLSSAVARMELRTKQAEQKIETLKQFKKAIKNASCLQCQHCSKFIACPIFTQHLSLCTNQTGSEVPIDKSTQFITQKPIPLQINITQTLVRECDNKPYTEYIIGLVKGQARWTITRKYKTFCELHNSLRIALPGVTLSDVAYIVNPQQGNRKSLLIEERRKLLEKYLRDISEIQLVVKEKSYINFMQLPRQQDKGVVGIDRALLPQSPQQFLKRWNERNLRLKETSDKRTQNSAALR